MGWDRPTAGKEKMAMSYYPKILEFLGTMQGEGIIESFEPMLLARHGGDLNGLVMIKGDAKKLAELRTNDTWLDLTVACSACLDSFGVINGYIGEGVTDLMTRYAKVIAD